MRHTLHHAAPEPEPGPAAQAEPAAGGLWSEAVVLGNAAMGARVGSVGGAAAGGAPGGRPLRGQGGVAAAGEPVAAAPGGAAGAAGGGEGLGGVAPVAVRRGVPGSGASPSPEPAGAAAALPAPGSPAGAAGAALAARGAAVCPVPSSPAGAAGAALPARGAAALPAPGSPAGAAGAAGVTRPTGMAAAAGVSGATLRPPPGLASCTAPAPARVRPPAPRGASVSGNTSQLPAAPASCGGGALLSLLAVVRASVRAQGLSRAEGLRAAGARAQAEAQACGEQARVGLDARLDAAGAALLGRVAQARAQVSARGAAQRSALTCAGVSAQGAGLARLEGVCAAGLDAARVAAAAPQARSEAEAGRAAAALESAAAGVEVSAQGVAARHGAVGGAAALALGQTTAGSLRGQAPALSERARAQGAARAQANAGVVEALAAELGGLGVGLQEAVSGVFAAASAAVASGESAAQAQLDTLEREGLAALEQARRAGHAALWQRTEAACARLGAEAEAGAQGLEECARSQEQSLGALSAELGALSSAEERAAEGALEGAEQAAYSEQARVGGSVEAALAARLEGERSALSVLDPAPGLSALSGALRAQLGEVHAAQEAVGCEALREADRASSTAVESVCEEAAGRVGGVVSGLEADNAVFGQELRAGVEAGLGEALTAQAGFAGRAEQAAEAAESPWWSGAGAGLWQALESLVSGLAVFVTLTAVLVLVAVSVSGAAVTAALVAACAAAAGAMLLVWGLVQSVESRLASGSGWGVSLVLAVPDALGLTALYEAVTGEELLTGARLGGVERWSRVGESVQGLLELLVARRGGRRRGPAAEVRRVPEDPSAEVEGPGRLGSPRTLAELQARLSPEARRGLEQAREWLGEARLEQSLEGLRTEDGGYDVARAEERFRRGAVSDEAHAERLSRRSEQAWAMAEACISRIANVLRESGAEGRPNAGIGDGSTEAALSYEAQRGYPVQDRSHVQKAENTVRCLERLSAELDGSLRYISDEARVERVTSALADASAKVVKLRDAVAMWRGRRRRWPDVWNVDGTSKRYTKARV